MSPNPSSVQINGQQRPLDGFPADDIAREVMTRLATQVVEMSAHGFHLAMQEPFESDDGPFQDDADNEEEEQ